ncbi:hypothetical protein PPGU19_100350 (plasmid) [Paraburkholderia sp. PGU19]|nr:hypothetical protein PPGU19_100350 [Paraburkholderia sp. PGU19]
MVFPSEARSGHDVDAPFDIERFARNPPRVAAGQKRADVVDVLDVDQLAERRTLGSLVEEQVEVFEAGGRPRRGRPRLNRMHSNALRFELRDKVAVRASSAAFTGPITV